MVTFRQGDPVVYRVSKFTAHPGPRAKEVDPAPRGELYAYSVDKFWVVADVKPDGLLLLETRRGKQHVIEPSDSRLRHARWWERLIYKDRFPDWQPSDRRQASAQSGT